jgi:hypothetical protein
LCADKEFRSPGADRDQSNFALKSMMIVKPRRDAALRQFSCFHSAHLAPTAIATVSIRV